MAKKKGFVQSEVGWEIDRLEYPHHRWLLPPLLDELRRLKAPQGSRLVDLGCGNAYVTSKIAELGFEVTGVESSRDGVAAAKRAFPKLRVIQGDLSELGQQRKGRLKADVVTAVEVVEHMFFPGQVAEAARAILSPGGHLVLSTPYHGYLKNLALSLAGAWDHHFMVGTDGGHIKFFSPKTLGLLLDRCGFDVVGFRGVGRGPYLWKSMIITAKVRG